MSSVDDARVYVVNAPTIRLADRILHKQIHLPGWAGFTDWLDRDFPEVAELIRADLRAARRINADAVAQYFFGMHDQRWDYTDFFDVSLPFKHCWIEAAIPPGLGRGWDDEVDGARMERIGALFQTLELDVDATVVSTGNKATREDLIRYYVPPKTRALAEFSSLREQALQGRWLTNAMVFFQARDRAYGPLTDFWFVAGEQGEMLGEPLGVTPLTQDLRQAQMARTASQTVLGWLSAPLLLTLCFMNAKGSTLQSAPPPPPRITASGKVKRRTRDEALVYSVLDIRPLANVLEKKGWEAVGLRRILREHDVRAHWHVYTADAPLFGKHVGRFRVPEHKRGSRATGSRLKDYRVRAPGEGSPEAASE